MEPAARPHRAMRKTRDGGLEMIDKETILRIARESGLGGPQLNGVDWAIPLGTEAFAAALLSHRAESGVEVPTVVMAFECDGSSVTYAPIGHPSELPRGAYKLVTEQASIDYGNACAAEALERAAKVCKQLEVAIDGGGKTYFRPADARQCVAAIRSLTP